MSNLIKNNNTGRPTTDIYIILFSIPSKGKQDDVKEVIEKNKRQK